MTQMLVKSSQMVITGTDGLEAIRYARDAFDQVFTAVEPAMGRTLEKELEGSREQESQAHNLLAEAKKALAAKDQASNAIQKGWDDEKAFKKLEQQKVEKLKKDMEDFRAAQRTKEEKAEAAKAQLLEKLDKQKEDLLHTKNRAHNPRLIWGFRSTIPR
ncbi:hypothetical protein R1sor_000760 [Riccia sorocarpa]|uniref:Uncharacterized protein n=1 Tax=Riccia sorocarpa TaxID=122646 RepID=A0ABD3GUB2_9MARC